MSWQCGCPLCADYRRTFFGAVFDRDDTEDGAA